MLDSFAWLSHLWFIYLPAWFIFLLHASNCFRFHLNSSRPIRFGVSLPFRERGENKENSHPHPVNAINNDSDSDDADGPVLYKDEEDEDPADEESKWIIFFAVSSSIHAIIEYGNSYIHLCNQDMASNRYIIHNFISFRCCSFICFVACQ